MQTFMPYEDISKTVKCLDYRRLGKQRVETYQVLNILLGRTQTKGWVNHPVTKMWRGYENALMMYQNYTIQEWIDRGYKNNMLFENVDYNNVIMPPWYGDEDIHKSHRLKLAWKNWEWYCDKFDDVIYQPETEPEYVWPV